MESYPALKNDFPRIKLRNQDKKWLISVAFYFAT